jgi:hypothetical protein
MMVKGDCNDDAIMLANVHVYLVIQDREALCAVADVMCIHGCCHSNIAITSLSVHCTNTPIHCNNEYCFITTCIPAFFVIVAV